MGKETSRLQAKLQAQEEPCLTDSAEQQQPKERSIKAQPVITRIVFVSF
jgi:hypothetical protein